MTIDQLNKLTDEEVRVRVAEALGWTYHGHSEELKMEALACWTPLGREFDPMSVIVLPDWSRDLNAAFTLVEKLRGDLWNVVIANYGVSWSVRFYSDRYIPRMTEDAAGPSLARAICLSFLSVTETEEKR